MATPDYEGFAKALLTEWPGQMEWDGIAALWGKLTTFDDVHIFCLLFHLQRGFVIVCRSNDVWHFCKKINVTVAP